MILAIRINKHSIWLCKNNGKWPFLQFQRILRYPLLIKEMLKLMDNESEEYRCLTEALVSVEKVANYINEMQMISETYSPRFEKLCENVDGVEVCKMYLSFTNIL